jgi:hypothetical protein
MDERQYPGSGPFPDPDDDSLQDPLTARVRLIPTAAANPRPRARQAPGPQSAASELLPPPSRPGSPNSFAA